MKSLHGCNLYPPFSSNYSDSPEKEDSFLPDPVGPNFLVQTLCRCCFLLSHLFIQIVQSNVGFSN